MCIYMKVGRYDRIGLIDRKHVELLQRHLRRGEVTEARWSSEPILTEAGIQAQLKGCIHVT